MEQFQPTNIPAQAHQPQNSLRRGPPSQHGLKGQPVAPSSWLSGYWGYYCSTTSRWARKVAALIIPLIQYKHWLARLYTVTQVEEVSSQLKVREPSRMRRYLRRLTSVSYGFLFVLWLYLSTTWRFWRWRIQHSHRTESTSIDMKQKLLFIRHGQSTWNAEELLPGQLPGIPLDEKGREQTALLADALAPLPISAIISSPLERALQTAEILAQAKGLDVQIEPDLIDTDVGRWAGQSHKKLGKIDPEWKAYVKDPTVAPEGVETFPQVQRRAVAAVERWCMQDNIGAYPAFVAHADIIKLLIAHYTGLDAGRAGTLFIGNASVSIVELDGKHRPRVIAIGWSPRPGWLKPPIEEPKEKDEQPKGSVQ